MGTHRRKTSPPTGLTHDSRDTPGGQRAVRRQDTGEDRLTGARWSTPLQPPDDRVSHVVRERQPILAVALAVDRDFTQTPVDVVEPQRGDLLGAQPKTYQHVQDREVPASDRPAAITTLRQAGGRRRRR